MYYNVLTAHIYLVGETVGSDGASQRSESWRLSQNTTASDRYSYVACMRICQLLLIGYCSLQRLTTPTSWLP